MLRLGEMLSSNPCGIYSSLYLRLLGLQGGNHSWMQQDCLSADHSFACLGSLGGPRRMFAAIRLGCWVALALVSPSHRIGSESWSQQKGRAGLGFARGFCQLVSDTSDRPGLRKWSRFSGRASRGQFMLALTNSLWSASAAMQWLSWI